MSASLFTAIAPSVDNVVYLSRYTQEPDDYMAELRNTGFFIIEIQTDEPIPWCEVRAVDFEQYFTDSLLSATAAAGQNEPFLPVSTIPLPVCNFTTFLVSFLYDKLGTTLFGKPRDKDLHPLSFSVFRFSATLVQVAQLVDSDVTVAEDDTISGYRVIFFDKPVKVLIDVFDGGPTQPTAMDGAETNTVVDLSFQGQRKAFWSDFTFLDDNERKLGLFGPKAYLKTSGHSSMVHLDPNQVLLLPAPCAFRPLSSEDNYHMATAYMPAYGAARVVQPFLARGLTVPAVTTKFSGQAKSFYDALPPSSPHRKTIAACARATFAYNPDNLRVDSGLLPYSSIKLQVWPPASTQITLLEQGHSALQTPVADASGLPSTSRVTEGPMAEVMGVTSTQHTAMPLRLPIKPPSSQQDGTNTRKYRPRRSRSQGSEKNDKQQKKKKKINS